MSSLSPLHTIGDQIGEALMLHHRVDRRSGARPGPSRCCAGSASRTRAGGELLPVRALRRPAPARHDRHGADLPAGDPDRRRADHRARRHHPGADPQADEGPAGRVRHVDPVHQPRPRRGRQHRRRGRRALSRPGDGARHLRRAARAAAAPLSAGAPARRAAAAHERGAAPDLAARGRGRRGVHPGRRQRRASAARGRTGKILEVDGPAQGVPDPQGRLVRRRGA